MAGITSKKKDAIPKVIKPYDAENITLSKAQYVEKQVKLREKALKMKAYGEQVDVEITEEKKKAGRPKKIE